MHVELKGGKFVEEGMSDKNYFVVVNFQDQIKRTDTKTIWEDSNKFSWNNEEFDFSVGEVLDENSAIVFSLVYEENNDDVLVGKNTLGKIMYYTDGGPERLCLMLENNGIVGDLNVNVCLHGCGVPPSPSTREMGGEDRAEPNIVRDRAFNFGYIDDGGEAAATEAEPTDADADAIERIANLAYDHIGEYRDAVKSLRAAFTDVTQKVRKDFKDKVGRNPSPNEIRTFFMLAKGKEE